MKVIDAMPAPLCTLCHAPVPAAVLVVWDDMPFCCNECFRDWERGAKIIPGRLWGDDEPAPLCQWWECENEASKAAPHDNVIASRLLV